MSSKDFRWTGIEIWNDWNGCLENPGFLWSLSPSRVEGLSQAPSWTLPPAKKPRFLVAKKTSQVALGKSQSWFKHVFSDFHSELLSSEAAHWNKHGSQVEGATVQYVCTYFMHSDNVSSNKHPLWRSCAFDYNHVSFVERNEQMFSANVWVQE